VALAFGVDVGLTAADKPLHEQDGQGGANQESQQAIKQLFHS